MNTIIREGVFLGHMPGFETRHNRIKRALLRVLIRTGRWVKPICPRINTYCAWIAFHLMPISGGEWGNTFGNDLLKLILQRTTITGIADAPVATPIDPFFWSLHSADPQAGTQTTSEITYTGYGRVSAARSSAAFTIVADVANPTVNVDFGARTDVGSVSAGWAAIGTLTTGGAGKILISGTLSPPITINQGTTPRIPTTSTITAA